jgi:hypothetical protein
MHDELNNLTEQTQVVEAITNHSDLIRALSSTQRVTVAIEDNYSWSAQQEVSVILDEELQAKLVELLTQQILELSAHLSNLRGMAEVIRCDEDHKE